MLSEQTTGLPRVGYVVKRYPRFSETFIVNEILAHEAAGLEIEIFSLRPPADTHFQDALARVRARVTYLPDRSIQVAEFWSAIEDVGKALPGVWVALSGAMGEDGLDVYQAFVLARLVQERQIGHLHAHFGSVAASVTRLAARFADVPYSFTAHAKDIFHESVCQEDLRHKLNDASAVITVSDYNLTYLRDAFGTAASHVLRVYNGLELDRFPYQSPRNRLPRIVAVGRLVEKKGFDVLIDACTLLAERGHSFNCRIVGTGELEDDLRVQVGQRGLSDVVELIGPRPQAGVIDLVQGAAAFAAPCVDGSDGNRDGLPTVLLEAMALGTPCVSTDVTGIPEIVRHMETGLMVPQRDADALAAALDQLLSDADLRVRLAEQARRVIEHDFDVHQNAASIRDVFRGVNRVNVRPRLYIEPADAVASSMAVGSGVTII